MRKRYIFLVAFFLLAGCALSEAVIADYQACAGNPQCVELMRTNEHAANVTATGLLAGMFASALTGVFAGHKLRGSK